MRTMKYLAVSGCLLLVGEPVCSAGGRGGAGRSVGLAGRESARGCLPGVGQAGYRRRKVAVPQLIKALQADDAELQRQAALALAEIGEGAAEAVPALAENLKAEDAAGPQLRGPCLGPNRSRRRGATEALIAALADKDRDGPPRSA